MSLRGWLDIIDVLTPRCQRCNRKIRNTFKCRTCGARLCSESCFEKHFNLAHAPQRRRQEAAALITELKKRERKRQQDVEAALAELKMLKELRKREADAGIAKETRLEHARIAKEKRLEQLRGEIRRATDILEKCLEAWQQAGSPEVPQVALATARQEADRCRALVREANRERSATSLKIAYLKLADFTRRTAGRLGMEWFITSLIGGAVSFTFGILFALLISRSLGLIFGLASAGFFMGFIAILCLLLLPDDNAVRKGIATLGQQNADQLDHVQRLELAYEAAQEKYENMARLHKLRTDWERASLEKQRLQEAYQAACDE
jgi:hypothetical protein